MQRGGERFRGGRQSGTSSASGKYPTPDWARAAPAAACARGNGKNRATSAAWVDCGIEARERLHYLIRMPTLTDDEILSFQSKLNAFDAADVHAALDGIEQHPLCGPDVDTGVVASGPLEFGSVGPGILVYRTQAGRVRIRITVASISGGSYDEIEVSDGSARGLVAALVAKLDAQ
jgi:hypothetical protein